MDPTLKALLDSYERLDAETPADRVSALETLIEELPRLIELTRQEWDAKLAHIQDDVYELGQQAERAAVTAERLGRRHEQAQRGFETLEEFASRRSIHRDGLRRDVDDPSEADEGRSRRAHDRDDHAYAAAVSEAASTRDAVLVVMRGDTQRGWTPQAVYDELRRLGRPTSRDSVQTFLQRAVGVDVRRVGKGIYRLNAVHPPVAMTNGHRSADLPPPERPSGDAQDDEPWLTSEILQRVAEEAQASFLDNHPGADEPEPLVEEAKRRVAVWIARHHQQPYDEAHVKRLMKTALDDRHRRLRRNGAKPRHHDRDAEEVTP